MGGWLYIQTHGNKCMCVFPFNQYLHKKLISQKFEIVAGSGLREKNLTMSNITLPDSNSYFSD